QERNSIKTLSPYQKFKFHVYWKVLNSGEEAIRRNCTRGQIKKGAENHTAIQVENILQKSF
ncbi:nucleotidyltransferase, partial [Priestia megaterium]|uniref:nucleotide-binding domain-containing protein n=1 Tax=Priestia megaterium TaxID=1404 RepID=UPI003AAE4829